MIKTTLKHYLYDMAIGVVFDMIGRNFATFSPVSYLGDYWMVVDEDRDIIAYGKCTEQFGNLILLDSDFTEYTVHTDLFDVQPITEDVWMTLQSIDVREAEESEFDT